MPRLNASWPTEEHRQRILELHGFEVVVEGTLGLYAQICRSDEGA